jgi:restriction endonuclease Mrr
MSVLTLSTTSPHQELRAELMDLSFHAFEECLRELLFAMGYTNVALTGRTHWRQRTDHGGRDLQAFSNTGLTRGLVAVQLKQYSRPVHRRFIDELRGTMLRVGARHGLVITTSTLSAAARKAAAGDHAAGIAPVRLIDGAELVDLLVEHYIGVWHDATGDREDGLVWAVDRSYFADLMKRFPGKANASAL